MPRDVFGFEGQHVTVWGRETEGSLYVGDKRPLQTTTTCGCGAVHFHQGFFSPSALRKAGWKCSTGDRWFCSFKCYESFDSNGYKKELLLLSGRIANLKTEFIERNAVQSYFNTDSDSC